MRNSRLCVLALFAWAAFLVASLIEVPIANAQQSNASIRPDPIRIPLAFEQNNGQFESRIRFLSRSDQEAIALTQDGVEFGKNQSGRPVRLRMIQANVSQPTAEAPTGGVVNYYRTRDRNNWLTGIPTFSRVRYSRVYEGIDAVFHGNQGQLEYDFEVHPGANPGVIGFSFDGAKDVYLAEDGSLTIHLGNQSWRLLPPLAYQMQGDNRQPVSAKYELAMDSSVKLRLGSYDSTATLVIDPVVQFAGVFAGNGQVGADAIRVDAAGNVFMAGTANGDYPVVNGNAGVGIYVTKLNPAADTILFSTFIQPAGGSSLAAVAVDAAGNFYLCGNSGGANFPVTTGLGTSGGFIMKLAPNGTILYSGLMNGTLPRGLAVDAAGNAYLSGTADTTLQTVNAFEAAPPCATPTCGGLFFAKVNPAGTAYAFSSYFYDPAAPLASVQLSLPGIGLDNAGNIYLAGSGSVPHLNTWQIGGALFVSKFAPDGKTLLFSTDFGNSTATLGGMGIGADGTVYLVGSTPDNDYPYSLNAFRHPEGLGGNLKIFATAINPALNGLTYSTYIADGNLGGTFVGGNGHLFIAGGLTGTFQEQNAVVSDVTSGQSGFYLELDTLGVPVSSSRFGGHLTLEVPSSITSDGSGNIFLAGSISPQTSIPQPDPVLVGRSFGTSLLTGGGFGSFFAKISPVNAPQISLNNAFAPFLFLRNASSVDLHVTSATFSGGAVGGNCKPVVPAASSCILTVHNGSGGLASGTVTIASDAQPAVQSFTVTVPPTLVGRPIGDFLWFDDDRQILPSRVQQIIPFRMSNVGTSAAVINLISINSPNTQTNDCGASLAPGATCTLQLTLNGGGANLIVFFDNGGLQTFSFFVPPVTQNLLVSTAGIRFPLQFVGGLAIPRTVTVTNASNADFGMSPPLLTGDPEFTIVGNTCGTLLASHQNCTVAVQFTPVIDGNRSAILSLANSTIQLGGQGEIVSSVQVAPLQLDFFPQVVHLQSFTSNVVLTNSLAAPAPITGITFSLADYTQTNDCAGQVPAKGSCTVQVTFNPQALGQRNATMTASFLGGAATQVLTLTGSSTTPFRVQPTNLSFTAAVGSTSNEQGVSIGNVLFTPEGYTFTVAGPFAIAQNPCANPLTQNGAPSSGCGPTLIFKPTAPGPALGSFTVAYAGITETDVVTLSGLANTVTASTLQLNFPVTTITRSGQLPVTLTNSGATPVGIASVTVAGSIEFTESDVCAGKVPGNGTCTLQVNFAPRSTNGSTGTMTINLADGAQYVVSLSGSGTGPVAAIFPASLTFVPQVVGTTSNNIPNVTIVNNGNAPLAISGISITGDFSQINNCPASLVSTCQVTINFSPKQTGTRTGTLTITDNGFGNPQQIALSGDASDFQLSAGATSSVTVTAGQTATFNLSASTLGSFSGSLSFTCAGAPSASQCNVSLPSTGLIGNVPVPFTVSVVTTAPHAATVHVDGPQYLARLSALLWLSLLPALFVSQRVRRQLRQQRTFAVCFLLALLAVGCGGGGTTTPSPTPTPTLIGGTAAGTYTITVTATDQTINGAVVHQLPLTLVVR